MLTAEQLEFRRNGIGGSDAGAVLGLSRFKSPVDVYLEKIGASEPEDLSDNDAVYWGNVLEDTVAAEYARRTGFKVQRRKGTFTHPQHSFMLANIDRWVVGQRVVLECKTAGEWTAKDWGPSGTDQVPDSYLIQCAHYMAVCDAPRCDLAVLIGGRDFRIYTIHRDPELEKMLIEELSAFWHDHVLARVPPPPRSVDDVLALYPADNGSKLYASPLLAEQIKQAAIIKAQIKDLERALENDDDGLLTVIKRECADHSEIVGPDGKPLVTWRKAKDSHVQVDDWKTIANVLRETIIDRMPEIKPIVEQVFAANTGKTITRTGSRWFLIK